MVAVFSPVVIWSVSPLALGLLVVPAGVVPAEEPAPPVVAGTISDPPVAVVAAPLSWSASAPELDAIMFPAERASEGDPAVEVVAGGAPATSDDGLD